MELGVLNRTSNIILICVCLILSMFTAIISYDIYLEPNTTEVIPTEADSINYSYSGNYLLLKSEGFIQVYEVKTGKMVTKIKTTFFTLSNKEDSIAFIEDEKIKILNLTNLKITNLN